MCFLLLPIHWVPAFLSEICPPNLKCSAVYTCNEVLSCCLRSPNYQMDCNFSLKISTTWRWSARKEVREWLSHWQKSLGMLVFVGILLQSLWLRALSHVASSTRRCKKGLQAKWWMMRIAWLALNQTSLALNHMVFASKDGPHLHLGDVK